METAQEHEYLKRKLKTNEGLYRTSECLIHHTLWPNTVALWVTEMMTLSFTRAVISKPKFQISTLFQKKNPVTYGKQGNLFMMLFHPELRRNENTLVLSLVNMQVVCGILSNFKIFIIQIFW